METKAQYAPHRIDRQHLKPLNDHVLASEMVFDERKLNSGIVLLNDNGKSIGIRPRWGQIYAVGPDQTEFSVGQWICVAHGRWTRGIEIEDESGKRTLRRVDPNDVLLTSDTPVVDETHSEAIHIEKKPDHLLHN